jgi:hypothetical protein
MPDLIETYLRVCGNEHAKFADDVRDVNNIKLVLESISVADILAETNGLPIHIGVV